MRLRESFNNRWILMPLISTVLVASRLYCVAASSEWVSPAPALPPPSGSIVRVSNSEEILSAGEELPPNSTMMIEPGVYRLPRPLVLRQKQSITIRSVTGEPASVLLKGKGWDDGDDRDDLVHVADCDGVLIAGVTFADCHSYGIKVEAEHGPKNVDIFNCRFRDIGTRAIKGSAGTDPEVHASRGSVRFCDFENTRIPPATWLFGGDYISAIDMMALDNWTFSDNVFRNIKGRNGGGRAAIFVWVRSRRVVVERNVILNCDRGISFGNPGQSTAERAEEPPVYVTDGIIQNNLIAGGADCGIELWHVRGIKIRHNSIWRPERNWARGIRVGAGTVQTEIVNNLVHGGLQIEDGQAAIHNNVIQRIDGFFVNASAGDLALTANAAEAIDCGETLKDVPYDFKRSGRRGRPDIGAIEFGSRKDDWIPEMKKVHARFKGTSGTFVQLGDSITFSGAFWSPLSMRPKNLNETAEASYQLMRKHLKPGALNQKGPAFGNQGSMTIRWARENIANWLAALNPEVAVLMFGSNDVAQMETDEFERTTRDVVAKCLANGTIVLLTTPPPQTAHIEKCLEFAAAIRSIASEAKVPLIDYCEEILSRRPFDWDGASAEFKDISADTYEVPTLISRDGVHPSNPQNFFNDFSERALRCSGYGLRNYLTMTAYADVIRHTLLR